MSPLAAAWVRHATETPDAPALVHPRARWTWADLAARVAATQSEPATHFVDAQDVPAFLVRLLAAERDGACLVPLASGLDDDERERRLALPIAPFPGLVVFTSGTTGLARGVRLPFARLLASARVVSEATDLQRGDAWLSALPMSHVGGIAVALRCVLRGAAMLLDDRFEPHRSAQHLAQHATHASFVARSLERTLEVGLPPSPSLKAVMVGGGPTTPALLSRCRALGVPALATYGMTEAGSTITLESPTGPHAPPSAGAPLPGVSLRIAGDDTIEVCTPSRMEGYLGEPSAPATAWLRTRDLGRLLPDGRLVVLDRRSDLIVSGGENVSPWRVEQVIAEDPSVVEVAVVGRADPSWGQRVVAVVRLVVESPEPAEILDALTARCRDRLAAHERPKDWVIAAEPLPRDSAGKLRRRDI